LHGKKQAANIGVEGFVEMLFGYFTKLSELIETSIDDQYVNSSRLLLDLLVDTLDIRKDGSIRTNGRNLTIDFAYGLIEFGLPATGDEYLHAFRREESCHAKSDPRAAPSDNCNFVPQFSVHRFLRLVS